MRIVAENDKERREIEAVLNYLMTFTVTNDKRYDRRHPVIVAYNWRGTANVTPLRNGDQFRVFDMTSDVLRKLESIKIEEENDGR